MLGREVAQRSLFEAYLTVEHLLPPGSFYDVLVREGRRLLSDDDFADCYDLTNGRPSVPPSRMAKLVLLQTYEDLSDRDALERMAFDLRWKAVLGMEVAEKPVGQSTLVEFRARLQLHKKMREVFDRFLVLMVEAGVIDPSTVQAVDSTAIWGRGAVEDTYNLIGSAVRKLLGVTAGHRKKKAEELAAEFTLVLTDPADSRSLKGRADIDWDRPEERRAFLTRVVEEARRLLGATDEDQKADPAVAEAAGLLRRILVQDLETVPDAAPPTDSPPPTGSVLDPGTEVQIRQGVTPDRIVSVGDAEMRCGHKSHQRTWNGYKAHASVECGAGFITGVAVSEASRYDGDVAQELLAAQVALGLCPEALVGDQAYSKAETRLAIAALGSEMVARVPPASAPAGCFSKDVFTVDLEAQTVTCPAGVLTRRFHRHGGRRDFIFPGETCAACALCAQCTARAPEAMRRTKEGRRIQVHPHEAIFQRARAEEKSPRIREILHRRSGIERTLAHLVRLGLRQARYKGRAKVEFQAVATALVVNLRRLGSLIPKADFGIRQTVHAS